MNSFTEVRKWEKFFWPTLATFLSLVLWHFSVIWTATKVFPSPIAVLKGIEGLLRRDILWMDIADSLRRVALGFGAAALLGIPAGLFLGWHAAAKRVVNPTIQILRPISPIAWIPVAIVLFGIGDKPAIFLIFLAAFFPIVIACVDGVATVPSVFRQAGNNFALTAPQFLVKVIFPAALPRIIMGLRLALGIAWLVVVAAEMIAVDSGLGYLVIDARNSGKRYDLVIAAMLIIGVIGLTLDMAFRRLGKMKSLRWGFRDEF